MKCPKCSFENRGGARFCKQCGQALPPEAPAAAEPSAAAAPPKPSPPAGPVCPACSAAVDSDARFCRRCGKPLPTEPTAAPSPSAAQVHIEGDVTGQIAIGNNILQIGDVHGGVVNVMMPGQKVLPKPRPTPIDLRPRPFPNLLDRETEVQTAIAACQSAKPVAFHGLAGLGKTSLLRHLAHHPAAAAFPDGVAYLPARRQPGEDLLQSIYDAFYEADIPYKPTPAQLRHDLRNKRAIILLDDVDLPREELEALLDAAPTCAFIIASSERRLWGQGQSIALEGLPRKEALALIERELGRPLTPEEQPTAQLICDATQGHPLRLTQLAAEAREDGKLLTQTVEREDVVTPSPLVSLDALSPQQRQVLAVLAAMGGAPVHEEHLPALTGLPDAPAALQALARRGLAQAHSPQYSPTGGLERILSKAWDLTPWMERALAHFTTWAEDQQGNPEHPLEEADAILAILEWAAAAGRWADVLRLGQAVEGALSLGKRWAAWEQVLRWTLQAGQELKDQAVEAWALHQLGTRALCLEDAHAARTALVKALRLRKALGDGAGAAITQHNLNLLPAAPPTPPKKKPPKKKPPTPKPRTPLPKWVLPVIGIVATGGIAIAVITALILLDVIPILPVVTEEPATDTPTATATPTRTATPSPSPSPTVTPTPFPWISIELADGCDRVYDYGDETQLLVESNTSAAMKVWLNDRISIGSSPELTPGQTWERDLVFDNITPGDHELIARLLGPDGEPMDEARCAFFLSPGCIDFEDLPLDSSYQPDDSFVTRYVNVAMIEGSMEILGTDEPGPLNKQACLSGGIVRFSFEYVPSGLSVRFVQGISTSSPITFLTINDEETTAPQMESFDGRTIGGVRVTVRDDVLELDGNVNELSIGGNNLCIDDICPSYEE